MNDLSPTWESWSCALGDWSPIWPDRPVRMVGWCIGLNVFTSSWACNSIAITSSSSRRGFSRLTGVKPLCPERPVLMNDLSPTCLSWSCALGDWSPIWPDRPVRMVGWWISGTSVFTSSLAWISIATASSGSRRGFSRLTGVKPLWPERPVLMYDLSPICLSWSCTLGDWSPIWPERPVRIVGWWISLLSNWASSLACNSIASWRSGSSSGFSRLTGVKPLWPERPVLTNDLSPICLSWSCILADCKAPWPERPVRKVDMCDVLFFLDFFP